MTLIIHVTLQMIDYDKLKLRVLTDKHIIQHASYLDEYRDFDNALDELLIEMYKKGYQDCIDNVRMHSND